MFYGDILKAYIFLKLLIQEVLEMNQFYDFGFTPSVSNVSPAGPISQVELVDPHEPLFSDTIA